MGLAYFSLHLKLVFIGKCDVNLHGSYGKVEKHQVKHLIFKTAPWVNVQHEDLPSQTKNIHPLGGHLGIVLCFSSKETCRIFFHPKVVADWI